MSTIEVYTQKQLDSALERPAPGDRIVCLGGTWENPLRVTGTATVWPHDSATVEAYETATVRAYDTATVEAYGTATVWASQLVAVHKHGTKTKINGGVVVRVPDDEHGEKMTA